MRSDLDSFALCCNFPSKSKAFGMCMYKNIMTFFKYPSFFGSIQFNNFWFAVFFGSSNRFSVWIFFCSHFFLFNKLELQATNSGLENIFLRKKLVLSKCNPYVLEIWFVISDLRFYFRFGICGKVTALIITNNWKCMSNYERFSDRYFVWDFITW